MKKTIFLLIILFITSIYTISFESQVLRINITSNEQLDTLRNLEETQKIDLFTDYLGLTTIDIRIPNEYRKEVEDKLLKKYKMNYKTLISDFQALIDEEKLSLLKTKKYETNQTNLEFFQNFRRIEEINTCNILIK
jgi:hypothetical protein